jgi:hypothetical protein
VLGACDHHRRYDGAALQKVGFGDHLGQHVDRAAANVERVEPFSTRVPAATRRTSLFYVPLREEKEGSSAGQIAAALD